MANTIVGDKATSTSRPRLLSLDFFRGFTVAAMILVNDPGDWGHIYWPLEHSKWNGCTPTDLVFPFFLFMVGVSIVYAMQGKKSDEANHGKAILSILRRTLIIVALGVCLPLISDFQFAHLRFPGVLQRIGVVFGITAIMYLKTNTRTQIMIAVSCLMGYYLIMTFVPVPGVAHPNLEKETNLGAYIDRIVFTTNHLWQASKTWDPEGLLGTIPAIGTCLLGVFAGTWLKSDRLKNGNEILKLTGAGVLLVILGLVWNTFFPINKQLWTSSFVLFTAGLAIIILSLSYWLIDVKGYKKILPPFLAFGRNAIAAYVLADVIPEILSIIPVTDNGHKTNIWSYMYFHLLTPNFSPENASLISAILTVIIIFIPVWILYIKKITVKI
ncbi:heparan-alpha-glucosaminide N-acetyltransferase domain-containing protein [Mucilaginibacter sp. KACC 22773]|uniref:acyltransferase family protein n=1 Tax=Mucilaginibacter sp. KACC 22773 TaxID=3025671 RepID=UPI002365734E|nr:heparan-alpha-glucosaminide N-acetyltransferase domain-containing protein [Mucilaginibacter sp. KACC 22773]WDF75765.1 heparan-alpha-glucosaminide N-acetyltransferase domain-containing protein [Mucilaginibacter sp. KACC 22773]